MTAKLAAHITETTVPAAAVHATRPTAVNADGQLRVIGAGLS